jgi:hypothetical protein
MVKTAMAGLRVDPKSLGDSAKTTAEKERLAAARVEEALDQLFATNGQSMVEVPPQLAIALRRRYSARINTAGIDRAVERGLAVRAALDSTRGPTMPGMPPTGAPPGGPPGRGGQPPESR